LAIVDVGGLIEPANNRRPERTRWGGKAVAKILIVDDDPDFLLVCYTVLKEAGYQVMEAANGRIALQRMREERPDLVLLDVMMSSILEGVDVSKEMESDPNLKDVPVVMVSSIATTEYAADFPSDEPIPIEAWISKPIQPAVLLRTVARFVE
jgi:CheY-like chemotaxis protein